MPVDQPVNLISLFVVDPASDTGDDRRVHMKLAVPETVLAFYSHRRGWQDHRRYGTDARFAPVKVISPDAGTG